MSASILALGHRLAMRSRDWVSHAAGSTYVVHLAGLQQRGDGCPCAAAAIRSGEQAVFSGDGLGPDGALDNVGVQRDQAVGQEALEGRASGESIANGLGQLRFSRDARQGLLPEGEQPRDDRCRDSLARGGARLGAMAAHLCLELPQIGHPLHRGGGDPAVPGSVKFVEPSSAVGPASRQPRTVIAPVLAQQLVAGSVAVHL